LGHASVGITANLYSHVFEEVSIAAMQRLGAAVARQTESVTTATTSGE
jgi:hypothetical protein